MSDKCKFGDADGTYFTTTTVEDDREKDQLGLDKVIFYTACRLGYSARLEARTSEIARLIGSFCFRISPA